MPNFLPNIVSMYSFVSVCDEVKCTLSYVGAH
jgi:hypothetical protein